MTGRLTLLVLSAYLLWSVGHTVQTIFAAVAQVLR